MILHAQGVVHVTREFTSNRENAELYCAPSNTARKVIATHHDQTHLNNILTHT